MPPVSRLDDLRRDLREKFPGAHCDLASLTKEREAPDDWELPRFESGTISEVVSSHPCSGMSFLVAQLLDQPHDLPIAFVDRRDGFDPGSYGNTKCRKVFWVRCNEMSQALQATDLLLRDGNLPLVLLDLHLAGNRELGRIPRMIWHRFRTQARESGAALLVLSPRSLVPSCQSRIFLEGRFSLNNVELVPPVLRTSEKLSGLAQKI